MKKYVLVVIIFSALCLTFGFTYERGENALNIKLNIKDLPEDGVILISPSDPAFDAEVNSLVSNNPSGLMQFIDGTKPFCVFLKNTSARNVAGYRLKWELLKNDGKVITSWSSASAPGMLSAEERTSGSITMAGALPIRPSATLFVSLESAIADILYSTKNSQINPPQEAVKKRNAIVSQLINFSKETAESVVSVTVSVDCAYFDNGTFVGPDSGNLLAQTQGYIDAERDLGQLVKQHIQEKRSSSELFDRIKAMSNESDAISGSNLTVADYKNFYLKAHARNLIGIRDKVGDSSAIEYTQRPLSKTWAKLHKKAERN